MDSAKKEVIYDVSKIWEIELEILDIVDKICKKHRLKYSLAYGSLLGAVRHHGFIPWDDDIDVIMPRNDYNLFIKLFQENPPSGFILQNKYIDEKFTQNFTKIRKDNTTFLHSIDEAKLGYHTGIFIDIFPGDRIPRNRFLSKFQFSCSALNLLLARNHTSKSGEIINVFEKIILSLPSVIKMYLYDKTNRFIQIWNDNELLDFVFPNTLEWAKKTYPYNMFEETISMLFMGRKYMCVSLFDEILSLDYGDYMKLPPESERVPKHHPVLIDLFNNYDNKKC